MSKNENKNILVIEDDSAIRELLETALNLEGYQVLTAAHGGEAWALLQNLKKPLHLLILDLMMPVMDGIEFLRLKNNSPNYQNIPTLVMSAASEKHFPEEGEHQVNLRKPIDLDDFLKRVEMLIA